jgi:hypothetical protein
MKYFFFIVSAIIIFSCTSTDKPSTKEEAVRDSLNRVAMADSTNYTTIQWLDSTNQDLGKIKEGSIVEISWKFKNTGTKPLIVASVIAGCGCTVADKPKEPIAPGQEGVIKARFNSQNQGPVAHKSVTVEANTKGQTNHSLNFTAQVTKE